ncbi:MAG TPA: 2-oxoacid:acceptor oxidoreductase subunit alpha [bacterium]|nr:2-oxoacid:acceptor oxidoreductase subunit alpha [bacterium]HPN42200.1 2-oxoacid:acceptor oxidoreductase subunit alpha [bacterium]
MKNSSNTIEIISGNEACAMAALAAGMRFYAGYPITPSSEIAEYLSSRLPQYGGVFIQMEDEIASIGAIIGASLTGVKAMTATSGPGFSLMQENIGYALMAEIPCVIVNVMRGGPSTGLPTLPSQGDVMQARWGTHGDHQIIALTPNSVRESYDMTIRAFNLSELYRTPVILLLDEIIGHVNEKMTIPAAEEYTIHQRPRPASTENYLPYKITPSGVPPMADFGTGLRYHVTGLAHDETGFPTNNPDKIQELLLRLDRKITQNSDDIIEVEEYLLEDAEIAFVAYGSAARSSRHTIKLLRDSGIKAGMLRLKTLWPFAEKQIAHYSGHIKTWFVPELNLGQIAHEVEWAVRGRVPVFKFNKINGEPINPNELHQFVKETLHV